MAGIILGVLDFRKPFEYMTVGCLNPLLLEAFYQSGGLMHELLYKGPQFPTNCC